MSVGNWEFFDHEVTMWPNGCFEVQFFTEDRLEVDKEVSINGVPRRLNLFHDVVFPLFQTCLAAYNSFAESSPGHSAQGAQGDGGLGILIKSEDREQIHRQIASLLDNLHEHLTLFEARLG